MKSTWFSAPPLLTRMSVEHSSSPMAAAPTPPWTLLPPLVDHGIRGLNLIRALLPDRGPPPTKSSNSACVCICVSVTGRVSQFDSACSHDRVTLASECRCGGARRMSSCCHLRASSIVGPECNVGWTLHLPGRSICNLHTVRGPSPIGYLGELRPLQREKRKKEFSPSPSLRNLAPFRGCVVTLIPACLQAASEHLRQRFLVNCSTRSLDSPLDGDFAQSTLKRSLFNLTSSVAS